MKHVLHMGWSYSTFDFCSTIIMASVVFDDVTTKEWMIILGVKALHQLHFKIACFWQHLFKNLKLRDGIPLSAESLDYTVS